MRELYDGDIRSGLTVHRGNVSIVAFKFGVDRAEFFEYVRARPELFNIVVKFREELVDTAETYLHEALDKKSLWATRFIMQTLGKYRLLGLVSPETRDAKNAEEAKTEERLQGNLGKITIEEMTHVDEMMIKSEAKQGKPSQPEPDYVEHLDQAGDKVLSTLAKNIGNLRKAAKELGVNKAQLADYLTRRPQLQSALSDKFEQLNDHAEDALHDLMDARKPWAIRFVLKTLGRMRGYSETPLNEMLKPSSSLFIRHLSMTDLCRLERLCAMTRPVPVTAPRVEQLPKAPTISEPNSVGRTANQPAVPTAGQIENKAVETKIAERAPAVNLAPVAGPVEQPVARKSERSEARTGPIWSPGSEHCPEKVIVLKPPPVDMTGFTPQQKMEMEILRERVSSKVRIQEVFNPDWPPDHPALRDVDDPPVKAPGKSNGGRAPPDST